MQHLQFQFIGIVQIQIVCVRYARYEILVVDIFVPIYCLYAGFGVQTAIQCILFVCFRNVIQINEAVHRTGHHRIWICRMEFHLCYIVIMAITIWTHYWRLANVKEQQIYIVIQRLSSSAKYAIVLIQIHAQNSLNGRRTLTIILYKISISFSMYRCMWNIENVLPVNLATFSCVRRSNIDILLADEANSMFGSLLAKRTPHGKSGTSARIIWSIKSLCRHLYTWICLSDVATAISLKFLKIQMQTERLKRLPILNDTSLICIHTLTRPYEECSISEGKPIFLMINAGYFWTNRLAHLRCMCRRQLPDHLHPNWNIHRFRKLWKLNCKYWRICLK